MDGFAWIPEITSLAQTRPGGSSSANVLEVGDTLPKSSVLVANWSLRNDIKHTNIESIWRLNRFTNLEDPLTPSLVSSLPPSSSTSQSSAASLTRPSL